MYVPLDKVDRRMLAIMYSHKLQVEILSAGIRAKGNRWVVV